MLIRRVAAEEWALDEIAVIGGQIIDYLGYEFVRQDGSKFDDEINHFNGGRGSGLKNPDSHILELMSWRSCDCKS